MMKLWLSNEIKRAETKLKYLNALLIMLTHVERADDYSDSDEDLNQIDVGSDDDSIKASDIRLVELDTDSDEE
jgi:hypothetical protein